MSIDYYNNNASAFHADNCRCGHVGLFIKSSCHYCLLAHHIIDAGCGLVAMLWLFSRKDSELLLSTHSEALIDIARQRLGADLAVQATLFRVLSTRTSSTRYGLAPRCCMCLFTI